MTTKTIVAISAVSLATSFAVGRYSVGTPAVTKVADIKKDTVKDTDRDTHRETTTVTEKDPGGKTTTTTTVTEDTTTKKHTDTIVDKRVDLTVTPAKRSSINVSALAALDLATKLPVYGIYANKEFIGPITLGAFGLTNGTIGVAVGLNF